MASRVPPPAPPANHHTMPRGHSNVYAEETHAAWGFGEPPLKACVPLAGGSRVDTWRPLPPLALNRREWEEIGVIMGWYRRRKRPPITRVAAPVSKKLAAARASRRLTY